jgi:MoxR-like ATPase
MVIATQNPIEHEGTYNLPEAQIDRFMMRISVGYPDRAAEMDIIDGATTRRTPVVLSPVVSTAQIESMTSLVDKMYVSPAVRQYIVSIVRATRELPQLRLGVSPRGSVALARAAKAVAVADARPFVTADDVKVLVPFVLGHRMMVAAEADLAGISTGELLDRVVASVPVPRRRDQE